MINVDFLLKNGIPTEWIEYVRNRCITDMRDHYFFWEAYQLLDLLEKSKVKGLKRLKILDAGCGFGVVDCLLVMMGGDLTLLDYDMEYLNKSREAFRESTIHNLPQGGFRFQFVKGDIFDMPFKGERFDLVWNGGVVEHFENPSEGIRQMAAITKPGGYVFVSVPAIFTLHTFIVRPHRRRIKNFFYDVWGKEKSYTERGLVSEMKKGGLKDIFSSTCNLRRAFIDDYVVIPRLKKFIPGYIPFFLNLCDWAEVNIPLLHHLGFTIGAIGRKA
ncbi:MAG: class I SAM-dependent methyltransferase [Nitrospinae bacterium]|nr:class I SAM-dependent methyltransferase [Nitrospinota bacterium]